MIMVILPVIALFVLGCTASSAKATLESALAVAVEPLPPLIETAVLDEPLIPAAPEASQGAVEQNESNEAHVDVPAVSQNPELPTGCEATAVCMLLNHYGIDISKTEVADQMPYTSTGDPNLGYVGNPYLVSGWTIYPPAWAPFIEGYAGGFNDLTDSGIVTLQDFLKQGKPVVCWVSMHGFSTHAILLTGYNQDSVFYNDPWTGEKDAALSWDEFSVLWATQEYRALSY
jgi:uncharacterized protein YvpB